MNCFADPCSLAECANPDATCVTNYCGACNAVFYDRTGQNRINCTGKDAHKSSLYIACQF